MMTVLLVSGISIAQSKSDINDTKHEVKSIVFEQFSVDWYKNQKKLWEEELSKNKNNLDAYFNAYGAIRALRNLTDEKSMYDSLGKEIAQKCYEVNSKSFEGNFLMYVANNYSDVKYLFEAHKIAPNDPRCYDDLMIEAEYRRDQENKEKYGKLMFKNHSYSPNLMNWCYNLIVGLEKNAILITHGDNDTYGAWLNQAINGTRKDVTVLNSYMLMKEEYRKKVYEELGMGDQFKKAPKFKSNEEFNNFIAQNISDLIDHSNRPFYVTNTSHDNLFGNRKEEFFIVGLAYQHCNKDMDNISVIRNNFENKYKLDYLETNFYSDPSVGNFKRCNTAYLTAMVKLYNHYCLSGEKVKAAELKEIILKIADENNMKDQVEPQLTGKC